MIENYETFHFKSFPGTCHHSESPGHPRAKSGKVGHAWASLGMTIPKCHTQLLPFMDVYLHAKNQSDISTPSRDINNQRILQSDWPRAFWPKTRQPEFSQTCGFRRMIENHNIFHLRTLWTNISWLNFSLKSKNPIFGPFWALFAQIWANESFPEKSGSVTFEPSWTHNFMQNIRKN